MNELEVKLAKLHNRKYCLLTGNGTTAIYVSLKAQGLINKIIAIPNNVCMNVVLPIYFSDNTPIFLDIEKKTLGLDISKIKNLDIDCIITVHSYGNICDIENIEQYCKNKNIFLIEDAALAQGLTLQNRPLGSFGDISILSFGSGKNLNINHGGAILTNNETLFTKTKELIFKLDIYSKKNNTTLESISKQHTKLYNTDYGKNLNTYHKEFKELCIDKKNNFLFKFDKSFYDKLNKKLNTLEELLTFRKNNSYYLKEKFKNIEGIIILEPVYESSYWRFNIFVEKYRDELFSYLLNKKYKVSSWYHSIDLLFEERTGINTPISDWVSAKIINIWVNEEIDKNYLANISDDIIDFLKVKYEKSI